MANLNQILDYVADNVIVDQGTSSDWTYRKWSNGTAECWKTAIDTRTTAFSATGSVYYRTTNVPLINPFFVEAPTVTVTQSMSNVGSACLSNVTTSTLSITEMSAVSTGRAVTLYIYCIGKWK